MASTVLPNGIIVPEKFSRDWYADLYHNWQELDNLLGGGTPKDGTLTIQQNGTTVGTFSANQSTNETIDITVPTVNDATLTIQQNGTTVDSFTANSSSDKTVNITVPTKTSDLTNDSNFVPSTDLATVATSGSYNDLSNKPTIPTVNNGTLTIQQNGTTVDSFTANSSTDKTVNVQCVDLTNNQTVGGIKTFSDAPVVSAITLDGKTIDTDANGNMTYDGHIVDTIEEQTNSPNGYIRYTNGIQICWGAFINNNNIGPGTSSYTFPKAFNAEPRIIATTNLLDLYFVTATANATTFSIAFIQCFSSPAGLSANPVVFDYIAIGTWK